MEGLLVVSLFACGCRSTTPSTATCSRPAAKGCYGAASGARIPTITRPCRGLVQTAIMLVAIALFALGGADPYAVVFSWMGAFSSLGILILQLLVSLAVIAFFWRNSRGMSVWRRLVAPGLSRPASRPVS